MFPRLSDKFQRFFGDLNTGISSKDSTYNETTSLLDDNIKNVFATTYVNEQEQKRLGIRSNKEPTKTLQLTVFPQKTGPSLLGYTSDNIKVVTYSKNNFPNRDFKPHEQAVLKKVAEAFKYGNFNLNECVSCVLIDGEIGGAVVCPDTSTNTGFISCLEVAPAFSNNVQQTVQHQKQIFSFISRAIRTTLLEKALSTAKNSGKTSIEVNELLDSSDLAILQSFYEEFAKERGLQLTKTDDDNVRNFNFSLYPKCSVITSLNASVIGGMEIIDGIPLLKDESMQGMVVKAIRKLYQENQANYSYSKLEGILKEIIAGDENYQLYLAVAKGSRESSKFVGVVITHREIISHGSTHIVVVSLVSKPFQRDHALEIKLMHHTIMKIKEMKYNQDSLLFQLDLGKSGKPTPFVQRNIELCKTMTETLIPSKIINGSIIINGLISGPNYWDTPMQDQLKNYLFKVFPDNALPEIDIENIKSIHSSL